MFVAKALLFQERFNAALCFSIIPIVKDIAYISSYRVLSQNSSILMLSVVFLFLFPFILGWVVFKRKRPKIDFNCVSKFFVVFKWISTTTTTTSYEYRLLLWLRIAMPLECRVSTSFEAIDISIEYHKIMWWLSVTHDTIQMDLFFTLIVPSIVLYVCVGCPFALNHWNMSTNFFRHSNCVLLLEFWS